MPSGVYERKRKEDAFCRECGKKLSPRYRSHCKPCYDKWRRTKNGDELRRQNRLYASNLRLSLEYILGGKCQCNGINCFHKNKCNIKDRRCLQIDHKRGGGTKELREKFKNNSYSMYRFYIDLGNKSKKHVQILCANCNWIKRYINKE